MTVPLFYARNPNQFLYTYALSSAYRAGYRVYDPDYALSREPDIWEKVRRDPIIAHALEIRFHQIAGREWTCEPASDRKEDKRAAGIMEELLKNVDNFLAARYALSHAVATARSYSFIAGERKPVSVDDGPTLNWWRPRKLQAVDRRRIFYEPLWTDRSKSAGVPDSKYSPAARMARANGHELHLKWKLWSVERGRFEDLLHPEYFVKLLYADEEGRLGYGRGLLEAIYYYYYVKTIVLREGVQGLERWAQGTLTAKIDGFREASADRPNATIQQEWLSVLEKMRSRHVAVYDAKDQIEVINNTGSGHQMVTEFLNYLDNAITRLILGSVLPSGGDGGSGSFARAQVETNTMEALIQFDRMLLDEALTRDLIGMVWRMNSPQLASVGLGKANMPRFRTVQEERANPERNAQVATLLINAGIPVRVDEIYRKTGWTRPTDDDDVFTRTGTATGGEAMEHAPEGEGEVPSVGPGGEKPKSTLPSLPTISEGASMRLGGVHMVKFKRSEAMA